MSADRDSANEATEASPATARDISDTHKINSRQNESQDFTQSGGSNAGEHTICEWAHSRGPEDQPTANQSTFSGSSSHTAQQLSGTDCENSSAIISQPFSHTDNNFLRNSENLSIHNSIFERSRSLSRAASSQLPRTSNSSGIVSYRVSTICLLYTSPSPRDQRGSRMPSSA